MYGAVMSLLLHPIEPQGPSDVIDEGSFEWLFDEVAGHLNAQVGRLLDLTIWAMEHPGAWRGEGMWTLGKFVSWRTGVSPAMAANVVAVAERAGELPHAVDALRRGEMSLDQLMPIVKKVPAWADLQATSLAVRLPVTKVRRLVNQTNWNWSLGTDVDGIDDGVDSGDADDADGADDGVVDVSGAVVVGGESGGESCGGAGVDGVDGVVVERDVNRVSFGTGDGGRWYLYADLDPDVGARLAAAIDEARDAVFSRLNSSSGADLETGAGSGTVRAFRPVSDVDALIELADRSMDTVTEPSRRSRYRVNLYLDVDGSLAESSGAVLPVSISRFVTCDGSLDPVFVESGLPVSVGRSQRTIPERTRRTVLHRDGHCCQVPGCGATRGLDLHHIVHWIDNGATDTCNLVTLCARHHRLHHRHRLGITGDADDPVSLRFTDHRGNVIVASGANPISPTSPPAPIRGEFCHPSGERLDRRWVTFVDPTQPNQAG